MKDGVIPEFDIVNVAIDLSATERTEYFSLTKEIGELLGAVCQQYGLFGDDDRLWIELHEIAEDEDCPLVKALLGKVFRRAEIVYTASARLELAPRLIRMLCGEAGRKLIVFFERIWCVDYVADAFEPGVRLAKAMNIGLKDIQTFIYHSGLSTPERDGILSDFGTAGPSALMACRALNEGLDVPTVDGAIIVAGTQSRRALIQRIGRTLRRRAGKARPVVILLHAKGAGDLCVDPNDEYFKCGARIFNVPASRACDFVRELASKGEAESEWSLIADMDRAPSTDLLKVMGDKAGLNVRVDLSIGSAVEGPLGGVLSRRHVALIGDIEVDLDRIRRVWIRLR